MTIDRSHLWSPVAQALWDLMSPSICSHGARRRRSRRLKRRLSRKCPAGRPSFEGSILDHELIDRLFERHSFDYVYHLAAYAAEGLEPFHQALQLQQQSDRLRESDQCRCKSQREVFRIHFLDRSLRRRPKSDVRRHDSRAGRFLRNFQTGGGARTACEPRDVWPGLRDLPSAQCLRRAPEYWRPVSQRRRNLHESASSRRADDDLRRWRAAACVHAHRRCGANHCASVELAAARNQIFNVGADVPYTVNDLAEIVAEAMGYLCEVNHLDARNEVKIAFSDHSKANVFSANA